MNPSDGARSFKLKLDETRRGSANDNEPAPSSEEAGPGKEDEELLKILDALGAKKLLQEMALEVPKAGATEP